MIVKHDSNSHSKNTRPCLFFLLAQESERRGTRVLHETEMFRSRMPNESVVLTFCFFLSYNSFCLLDELLGLRTMVLGVNCHNYQDVLT